MIAKVIVVHHPNMRLAARYKVGVGWFWLLTLEVQVAVEIGPGRPGSRNIVLGQMLLGRLGHIGHVWYVRHVIDSLNWDWLNSTGWLIGWSKVTLVRVGALEQSVSGLSSDI